MRLLFGHLRRVFAVNRPYDLSLALLDLLEPIALLLEPADLAHMHYLVAHPDTILLKEQAHGLQPLIGRQARQGGMQLRVDCLQALNEPSCG